LWIAFEQVRELLQGNRKLAAIDHAVRRQAHARAWRARASLRTPSSSQ